MKSRINNLAKVISKIPAKILSWLIYFGGFIAYPFFYTRYVLKSFAKDSDKLLNFFAVALGGIGVIVLLPVSIAMQIAQKLIEGAVTALYLGIQSIVATLVIIAKMAPTLIIGLFAAVRPTLDFAAFISNKSYDSLIGNDSTNDISDARAGSAQQVNRSQIAVVPANTNPDLDLQNQQPAGVMPMLDAMRARSTAARTAAANTGRYGATTPAPSRLEPQF